MKNFVSHAADLGAHKGACVRVGNVVDYLVEAE